jgi:DNA replicative helicase MCM subunit Mcm2 (Cdc46/Mcm family)
VTRLNISVKRMATHENTIFSLRSDSDLEMIRRMQSNKNIFPILVASLCPGIHGHHLVKASLLLSLAGGTVR